MSNVISMLTRQDMFPDRVLKPMHVDNESLAEFLVSLIDKHCADRSGYRLPHICVGRKDDPFHAHEAYVLDVYGEKDWFNISFSDGTRFKITVTGAHKRTC